MLRPARTAAGGRRPPLSTGVVAGIVAAAMAVGSCGGTEAASRPASAAGGSVPTETDGSAVLADAAASTVPTATTQPKYHPETPGHQRLVAIGIPDIAARAYLNASVRAGEAFPDCTMPPEVLAAVGGAESRNGQVGGDIDLDGNTTELIRGFAETGPDTDGGELDHDTEKDWAVGPMQFIPGTWRDFGRDGNGDGRTDPGNIFDAALAAAAYLCHQAGPFPTAAFINTQWNQWDQRVAATKQRTQVLHDQWQKLTDRRKEIQDYLDEHPDDTADAQVLARLPQPGPEPMYEEPDLLPGPAQFTRAVEGYYGPAGDVRDDYVQAVTSGFRSLTNATGGVVVTPDDRWT